MIVYKKIINRLNSFDFYKMWFSIYSHIVQKLINKTVTMMLIENHFQNIELSDRFLFTNALIIKVKCSMKPKQRFRKQF